MTTDSTNVRVGVSGEVLVGLTSATAPSGPTGPVTGFTGLGFVSEDGVTEKRDRSMDNLKAWQNAALVRTVVTDSSLTYSFTLMETKKETVELYYGTTVKADGSLVIVPANTGGRKAFLVDVVDGSSLIRTYIPAGEVTEVGDKVYASGEAVGYEITITAYPDNRIKDENGNAGSAKQWCTDLVTAPAGG